MTMGANVRLVERQGARAMTVAASMLFDPECFTPAGTGAEA